MDAIVSPNSPRLIAENHVSVFDIALWAPKRIVGTAIPSLKQKMAAVWGNVVEMMGNMH